MSSFPRHEIEATHDRYIATRERIVAGEVPWTALADFFTEDATFIDPAWGRVEGRDAICEFLAKSMAGLEGWTFPHEWRLIEGDRLVASWQNRLPGTRPDGTPYQAHGLTVMVYAGNGKFSYEEDLLNMAHVFEVIQESGWTPSNDVNLPPSNPRR